jgi:protein phosphatase
MRRASIKFRHATLTVNVATWTDIGLVRENNEDAILFADLTTGSRIPHDTKTVGSAGLLLGVCDGMGGASAGEVASKIAVQTIADSMSALDQVTSRDAFAKAFLKAVEFAGDAIRENANNHKAREGMGTTCTAAAVRRDQILIAQVGDSRAYLLRRGALVQLTKDQTLIRYMLDRGLITSEGAARFPRHGMVLQALGATTDASVDLTTIKACRGDRLLICSDGLSGFVSDATIRDVLDERTAPDEACLRLVHLALKAGGRDNITTVVCDLHGDMLEPPTEEDIIGPIPYSFSLETTSFERPPVGLPAEEGAVAPSWQAWWGVMAGIAAVFCLVAACVWMLREP